MKDTMFTNKLERIPKGMFTVRLAIDDLINVDLTTPNPTFLNTTSKMSLMISSISHKEKEKLKDTIVKGMVKASGPPSSLPTI